MARAFTIINSRVFIFILVRSYISFTNNVQSRHFRYPFCSRSFHSAHVTNKSCLEVETTETVIVAVIEEELILKTQIMIPLIRSSYKNDNIWHTEEDDDGLCEE